MATSFLLALMLSTGGRVDGFRQQSQHQIISSASALRLEESAVAALEDDDCNTDYTEEVSAAESQKATCLSQAKEALIAARAPECYKYDKNKKTECQENPACIWENLWLKHRRLDHPKWPNLQRTLCWKATDDAPQSNKTSSPSSKPTEEKCNGAYDTAMGAAETKKRQCHEQKCYEYKKNQATECKENPECIWDNLWEKHRKLDHPKWPNLQRTLCWKKTDDSSA